MTRFAHVEIDFTLTAMQTIASLDTPTQEEIVEGGRDSEKTGSLHSSGVSAVDTGNIRYQAGGQTKRAGRECSSQTRQARWAKMQALYIA